MNQEEKEKFLKELKEMTPEEFEEKYFTEDTVIPTKENMEKAANKIRLRDQGIKFPHKDRFALDAEKWYDKLMKKFCLINHLNAHEDTRTLFQVVGWDDDNNVIFSADITVYFRRKNIAEKFAKVVNSNCGCSVPDANFSTPYADRMYYVYLDDGINGKTKGEIEVPEPDESEEFPYFVHWYVDVRDLHFRRRRH